MEGNVRMDRRSKSVTISEEETRDPYRAYIRRLSGYVTSSRLGDAKATLMLGTAAPNEVKEAKALLGL
jgi:hypothetical protein